MAVIKTVTNGSSSVQFKAVSLGHAVTIAFGLCSIIVAQQTWLWAGAHERDLVVATIRAQIASDISIHAESEDKRLDAIDRRLNVVEDALDATQRQVNINTGRLESMGGRK